MKMETSNHEQIKFEIHNLAHRARQAQQTDTTAAVRLYEEAYKKSRELDDDILERECALNLGAAHVAEGNAQDGLKYLHKATPENNKQDIPDSYYGDLYFNKGMALEMQGDTEEALDMFDKGKEAYKNNAVMEKKCFISMGRIFCDMAIHERLDPEKKAKAELYADKCRQLNLNRLPLESTDYPEVSQIYNEVGLLYTQLQCYDQALQCFEIAAELCKQSRESQRDQLMAVICQNQGAVYNFQGKYKESIEFHQKADKMYTKINSYRIARNGQGQCYINLAYAYFQLHEEEGDFLMDRAFRTFNDAKKAAEDTEDKNMLWQAYEGLGAVYFHRRQYSESVKQYREAVRLISDEDNSNRVAEKLERALQFKMAQAQPGGAYYGQLLQSNQQTAQFQPSQTQNMQSAIGGAEGPITFRSAEVPIPTDQKEAVKNVTVIPVVRRGQIRMRKKDSFGPHLPKVAQGFGVLSQRSSTLTSRDVAESPRQMRATSVLDTENLTEESTSEEESETGTDSSEEDDVETEDKKVGTSPAVQEIFRKNTTTANGMSPVKDDTHRDVRQYENMLQQKEANEDQSKDESEDDSDEDSEEEDDTTDNSSSTDDDDDDDVGKNKSKRTSQAPPSPPSQSPPLTALNSKDIGTYEKPHAHTYSNTRPGQNDERTRQSPIATTSDIDPPYATIGTITRNSHDDTTGNDNDKEDINKTSLAKRQREKSSTKHKSANFFDSDTEEEGDATQRKGGSRGFRTVKNDSNQRTDDDDENVILENLPRGERERILHEQHVKRRQEEDNPPPLPDRKEGKSKTCLIM